jgi:hypothetical protein
MTQERYLLMCEQLGKEPNLEEMPPDWNDFSPLVHQLIDIFNKLGDRVIGDIGYIGKDFTNLNLLLDVFGIEDREFAIEFICWLDSRAIKKASESLKRERDKLKRKPGGPKRN